MLRAYLRGLLAPDYPMGAASRRREDLVLLALDAEQTSAHMSQGVSLQQACLPLLAANTRKETVAELNDRLEQAGLLSAFDFKGWQNTQRRSRIMTAVELFKVLEAQGIIR